MSYLVVIDEVSMVNVVLMNQLVEAIPDHAAVLIAGDADQLPSVGPEAMLADIVASKIIFTVRLTEISARQPDSGLSSILPGPTRADTYRCKDGSTQFS